MPTTLERQSALREQQIPLANAGLSWTRVLPVIFTLLAFGLRLFRLDYQSLWYDEAFGVYLAKLDLTTLTQHTAGDIHPPLYYYLLHFWIKLAGDSMFAVRFFSLFFGVLLVAMVYRLTLRLTTGTAVRSANTHAADDETADAPLREPAGPWIACLAAALVAISPFQLWYGQETRMYTLAALLGLAIIWFLLDMLELPPKSASEAKPRHLVARIWGSRWRAWVGYALLASASLYLLYYMAFLLIFLNLFALVLFVRRTRSSNVGNPSGRSLLIFWLSAQVAVVLLYLPWLPVAIRQAVSPAVPPWRHFVDLPTVLADSWSALALGQSIDQRGAWATLLLFLFVYLLGIWWTVRHPKVAVLTVGAVWAPLAIIFALSYWSPLFHVRYVFPYAPLFYVTLALGFLWLYRRSAVWATLVAVVLVGAQASSAMAYYTDNTYARDDFRSVGQFLDRNWREGDVILLDAGYIYPAVTYYLQTPVAWRGRLTDFVAQRPPDGQGATIVQAGSIGAPSTLGRGDARSDFYATTEAEAGRDLAELANRYQRLWLVRCYDTVTDPQGFVRDWLGQHGALIEDTVFSGASNMRVQGYILPAGAKSPAPVEPVSFGGNVLLTKHAVAESEVTAGSNLDVDLAWRVPAMPGSDFRAYLALKDPQGRIWQQQDEKPAGRLYPPAQWPAGADVPDPRRIGVLAGTPPGKYELVLGVYEAATGQPFDWLDARGTSQGPQYDLATVQVTRPEGRVQPPPMQRQVRMPLGSLNLLGYNVGTYLLKPGDALGLELLWQASRVPGEDLQPHFALRDRQGRVWGQAEGSMVGGQYPTTQWQTGELVRDHREIALAADAPDGSYDLVLTLEGKDTHLANVNVRGRPRSFTPPGGIANAIKARFGAGMELTGFDLRGENGGLTEAVGDQLPSVTARPGETLHLTLYWLSHGPTPLSLTVFTQLLDGENHVQGQRDQVPGRGEFPTTSWANGEYLIDTYDLTVKPDAPAGDLTLVVGVYNAVDGVRQPLYGADGQADGDALPLARVTVAKP